MGRVEKKQSEVYTFSRANLLVDGMHLKIRGKVRKQHLVSRNQNLSKVPYCFILVDIQSDAIEWPQGYVKISMC